jgi:hypothetical protein
MGKQESGTLIVSIDLPKNLQSTYPSPARELLSLFGEYAIPATWVASTLTEPIVESILQSSQDHEIALQTAPASPRRETAEHLMRTHLAAARSGVSVTSLTMNEHESTDHLDLVAKHGFSIVRPRLEQAGQSVQATRLQLIRYGIWRAPVSAILQINDRSAPFGKTARTVRALKNASKTGGLLHLGLDAATNGTTGRMWSGVRQLLATAAKLRDRDALQCVTLQQAAAQLQQRGQAGQPSRSVLRAA